MAGFLRSNKPDKIPPIMKQWYGGRAYDLTKDEAAELDQHIKSEVVYDPQLGNKESKGTRSKMDSEKIALEWLQDNDIKPLVLGLLVLLAFLVDYFAGGQVSGEVMLAQILVPALTTGAGVNTVTPAQTQVESDILIGDIDTPFPLRGLKVNVDGDTPIDVQLSQPLMSVYAKLSGLIAGTVVGLLPKISTGRVICKSAVITFTNDAATTPTVYWNSQRGQTKPGRLIRAQTTTINPNSNQTFTGADFAYLAITNPTNVTSFDFTFSDGTQQNMSVVEADALFAKYNQSEANGRLDAVVTCIDGTRKDVASVKINVGATAIIVMIVK